MKYSATLVFEGGSISFRRSGHGEKDGGARFTFKEDDLEHEYDDTGFGGTRWVDIEKSEMIELRDFLNKELPPEQPKC